MRLDPRIKDAAYIADCFTADTYHKRIGKPCYFAQHIEEFCNLENCALDTLKSIDTITSFPFRSAGNTLSRFCLAAEFVEKRPEDRYRSYTLTEFVDAFEIGKPLKFRPKKKPEAVSCMLFGGFSYSISPLGTVLIGGVSYLLSELLEEYERWDDAAQEWVPFGVVEGKE